MKCFDVCMNSDDEGRQGALQDVQGWRGAGRDEDGEAREDGDVLRDVVTRIAE